VVRDIAVSDTEGRWTEEALAEKLGVIQQTVNTWISDIRARQRAARDIINFRLNRLGQIAQAVGLSRNRISESVGNTNFGNIDILLSQGRDMDYIADHYNMDLALVWALRKEYQDKANEKTPSILSFSKERYEKFFEGFFRLAHRKVKETTRIAFLNADWRDFESTPVLRKNSDHSINIFDYHRILSKTGWKVAEVARQFYALGFTIVATEGSHNLLTNEGIPSERIFKMHEGRPNIADGIKNATIQLIINTPVGKQSQYDDSYIRKAAIKYKTPYITTLAGAFAAVKGITAYRKGEAEVRSLQSYHAAIK